MRALEGRLSNVVYARIVEDHKQRQAAALGDVVTVWKHLVALVQVGVAWKIKKATANPTSSNPVSPSSMP
jgi:hypothetical protein